MFANNEITRSTQEEFLTSDERKFTITCRGREFVYEFNNTYVDTRLWCTEFLFRCAKKSPVLEKALASLAFSLFTHHFNGYGSVHPFVQLKDTQDLNYAAPCLVHLPAFVKARVEVSETPDAYPHKISLEMELPPVNYLLTTATKSAENCNLGWNWILEEGILAQEEREEMFAKYRDWIVRFMSY